jgi:hypothetical protein
MWRDIGNQTEIAWALTNVGYVALHQHQWQVAHTRFAESLPLHWELRDKGGLAACLTGMAWTAEGQGQPERAVRLLGTREAFLEAEDADWKIETVHHKLLLIGKQTTNDTSPEAIDPAEYEHFVTAVRDALGEEAFAAALAKGRKMSLDEAIALALEEPSTQ